MPLAHVKTTTTILIWFFLWYHLFFVVMFVPCSLFDVVESLVFHVVFYVVFYFVFKFPSHVVFWFRPFCLAILIIIRGGICKSWPPLPAASRGGMRIPDRKSHDFAVQPTSGGTPGHPGAPKHHSKSPTHQSRTDVTTACTQFGCHFRDLKSCSVRQEMDCQASYSSPLPLRSTLR